MRKHITLWTLLLCLSIKGFAQTPGHLGKHFFLNAECVFSPAWLRSNTLTPFVTAETNKAIKWLGFNYIVNPSVEYNVWKKGSVGVGYNFFQSPVACFTSTECLGKSAWYDMDYKMQSHGFSIFYKHYLNDGAHPFGAYFRFQLDGFFNYYCPYEDSVMWVPTAQLSPEDEQRGRTVLFGAKVESGAEYMVLNRIRFSAGVSLGSTFGGYNAIHKRLKYEWGTYAPAPITIKEQVNNRLLNAYYLGIRVGVDVLLF